MHETYCKLEFNETFTADILISHVLRVVLLKIKQGEVLLKTTSGNLILTVQFLLK